MDRINVGKDTGMKERDCRTKASEATWYDLLLTVIWPVNRTEKKVTVVCAIVRVIVIKACVGVCVCAGHVLLNVQVSLRVVRLVLIRAEGFTASNTLSWRGTSDILFTSLPL